MSRLRSGWTAARAAVPVLLALTTCAVGASTASAIDPTTPSTPATTPISTSPATTPATTPAPLPTVTPSAPAPVVTDTDPVIPADDGNWTLPDRLAARLDAQWSDKRQLYVDRGSVSIRANAMLLEMHALAALAGHTGPARQDDRIPGLVKLFTTSPVFVTSTKIKRVRGSFPHVPAWESAYRSDPTKAVLHPSADAIVARALETAWRARDISGLPADSTNAIEQVVGAVAHGPFYKAPNRAENQINWNTDVYEANLIVNGDRSNLPDYRAHLTWFIDHAFKPAYKNGSSNLSKGYGFRYLPQFAGGNANKVDTVEYANLVHSALGFYQTAVLAGMRPLDPTEIARLNAWTRHIIFGTWTDAGYLNWDTGLDTARRNQRQYWAFALDSLVRSSGPGALIAIPNQRSYVKHIAEQALALFSRTAWDGTGPLPPATEFNAPNGFPEGTKSPLITPLRFAIVAAELDVRLPATSSRSAGNTYAQDGELGRLVVSTPSYNLGIIKPVAQGQGGLEPTRLFDGQQRPLTTLGAGGFGGPAPGVVLARGNHAVLDDQPGTQTLGHVPGMSVSGDHRNRSGQFNTLTAGGTMHAGRSTVSLTYRFATSAIETTYHLSRGSATNATVTLPVWGTSSSISVLRGGKVIDGHVRRTSGAILVRCETKDGAVMMVAFRGIPDRATMNVVRHGGSSRAPSGARELQIRFKLPARLTYQRRISIAPVAAPATP